MLTAAPSRHLPGADPKNPLPDQEDQEMVVMNPVQKFGLQVAANVLVSAGPRLVQNRVVRRQVIGRVEKELLSYLEEMRADPECPPGIADDRTAMGLAIVGTIERALAENRLSEGSRRAVFKVLVKNLFIEKGDLSAADRFQQQYGMRAPTFLTLSPGKACNLRCTGCYADSTDVAATLAWSTVDRLITEAKTLWGARFFVFSGGEPFAYRSEGKGILDLVEKHSDCFFLSYTNGTLINEKVTERLAQAGNLLPAISVEGGRERTDARRGAGVFDRVLETMSRLRVAAVPFGISLTATRLNAEEILSDEFIDFFQQQGALFGFIFQYMPIGRSFTLDLMVTPEQRLWMWRRSWEIVRSRRMFVADFWNSGTACDGCLSAGGHGGGGYFYVDWNGAVSPCVFLPYSPLNINEVYARGETLNDVWADPFFHDLRQWQFDYKQKNGNGLAPCPIRDHNAELQRLLREHEPDPIDANAAAALLDPDYARGLDRYNAAYESVTHDIWEGHYLHGSRVNNGIVNPLPDIPQRTAAHHGAAPCATEECPGCFSQTSAPATRS
jgi:MoaA/NifB/PqqE/SkfB family radical SAM enzyme